MSRKYRSKIKPFPTPDKMQPIDPDEFITAVNWAMNAASGKAHINDVTKKKINLREDDGNVSEITFTDTPLARAVMALNERYKGDSDKYVSISMRMLGLGKIMHDPSMSEWIKMGDEFSEVHPAIMEAAATVMLGSEGEFPMDVFSAKVKELAAKKYKNEEF